PEGRGARRTSRRRRPAAVPAVPAALPQRGGPGGRSVAADPGALPWRAPPDPGPQAARLLFGRDSRADRPAPGQRAPHPADPRPAAGLQPDARVGEGRGAKEEGVARTEYSVHSTEEG